jgi:uncharacterized protein
MSNKYDPQRLDVRAFARDAGEIMASEPLQQFERLALDAQETGRAISVNWSASGELKLAGAGEPEIWLHVKAHALVPMVCQRCLDIADNELNVQRSFRFAASEEQAAALDDECEEDVLVLERDFKLRELVEDELLMALPLVAAHTVCPQEPTMQVADAGFDAEIEAKPHPFAQLASLQKK